MLTRAEDLGGLGQHGLWFSPGAPIAHLLLVKASDATLPLARFPLLQSISGTDL